jgi:hypothetical protein
MNSRLGSTPAESTQGRYADERAPNSRAMEPPLHPSEIERLKSEHRSAARRVLANLARAAIIFCIGVGATLAWQSYGNAARWKVASFSPRLGWLAPAFAPAEPSSSAPAASASPDQLAALSRSLAAVRQSVDKLAADITKLQATKQDPPPARVSTAAGTQGRKSGSTAQAPSAR